MYTCLKIKYTKCIYFNATIHLEATSYISSIGPFAFRAHGNERDWIVQSNIRLRHIVGGLSIYFLPVNRIKASKHLVLATKGTIIVNCVNYFSSIESSEWMINCVWCIFQPPFLLIVHVLLYCKCTRPICVCSFFVQQTTEKDTKLCNSYFAVRSLTMAVMTIYYLFCVVLWAAMVGNQHLQPVSYIQYLH